MKKFFKKIIDKIFLIREIKSQQGVLHFKRWRLISTPLFNIFIHFINKEDSDSDMHDHPWDFISVILKNGYKESTTNGVKIKRRFSISFNRAERIHKISELLGPTWTFVLTGPRRREWGYLTDNGWMNNDYYRIRKNILKVKDKDKFPFVLKNIFKNKWNVIHFIDPGVLRLANKYSTVTLDKKENGSIVLFQLWIAPIKQNIMFIVNPNDPLYNKISGLYDMMSLAAENK